MSLLERIDRKLSCIESELDSLELEVDVDNLRGHLVDLENLIGHDDDEEVIILCPACLRESGIATGCKVCDYTGLIYNPKRFED